ncbi:MAG: hypothetical protein KJ886_02125 [Candidatus Thermoplasmatota archaeon]|nr:hypothetical protein [Candidatus Thermoplasmatota archaeon]MBU4255635.1 hypothetical protein [Candidatus Thermoplasmatota archaeon]
MLRFWDDKIKNDLEGVIKTTEYHL